MTVSQSDKAVRFRALHELQRLPSARLGNSRTPMSPRRQHLADRPSSCPELRGSYSSTRSNRGEDWTQRLRAVKR